MIGPPDPRAPGVVSPTVWDGQRDRLGVNAPTPIPAPGEAEDVIPTLGAPRTTITARHECRLRPIMAKSLCRHTRTTVPGTATMLLA